VDETGGPQRTVDIAQLFLTGGNDMQLDGGVFTVAALPLRQALDIDLGVFGEDLDDCILEPYDSVADYLDWIVRARKFNDMRLYICVCHGSDGLIKPWKKATPPAAKGWGGVTDGSLVEQAVEE
jgi:hypothetical protein